MNFQSFYYGYELINTNFYFLYAIIIYIFLIWNREIASQCLRSIKKIQRLAILPSWRNDCFKKEWIWFYVCYKCKYILSIFNKSVPLFPIKGCLKSKYFSFNDIFKQQVHLHFNYTISIFIVSMTVTKSLNSAVFHSIVLGGVSLMEVWHNSLKLWMKKHRSQLVLHMGIGWFFGVL